MPKAVVLALEVSSQGEQVVRSRWGALAGLAAGRLRAAQDSAALRAQAAALWLALCLPRTRMSCSPTSKVERCRLPAARSWALTPARSRGQPSCNRGPTELLRG